MLQQLSEAGLLFKSLLSKPEQWTLGRCEHVSSIVLQHLKLCLYVVPGTYDMRIFSYGSRIYDSEVFTKFDFKELNNDAK